MDGVGDIGGDIGGDLGGDFGGDGIGIGSGFNTPLPSTRRPSSVPKSKSTFPLCMRRADLGRCDS